MAVRFASLEDATDVLRLSEELGYPNTLDGICERLAAAAGDPHHAVLVATSDDGSVVGCVHVVERLLIIGGRYAELGGMIVDARARGLGFGRELMSAAEDWARQRGLDQLRLRTGAERAGAHAFYERLGYTYYKDQRSYRRDLA